VSPARRARGAEPRRAVVLVAAASILAVLAAVSVRATPHNGAVEPSSVAAIPLGAESSAFYCGGLEHAEGVVESDVAIADLSGSAHVVEITTTNELNQVSLRQIRVHPGHVVHISPANLVGGSLEAVSIVSAGGGIAATESIRGVNGAAVAPCLTRASGSWWLTGGSTKKGQSLVLSVFNPYASAAVVAVTFQTPGGVVVPSGFQGLVLGPHQLAALSVHAVAPNVAPITTHVVATFGAVVVYGIERSTSGAASIALLPGTPSPTHVAWFPVGSSIPSRTTQLVLTNTSLLPVGAAVRVWAPAGCARHCPAPFDVTIAQQSTALLTLSPSTRVPAGTAMSAEVVADGAGLVAAQRVTESDATGANAPIADPGLARSMRLVLVNPLASGFDDVGIVNPTGTEVRVSLETVARGGPRQIGVAYTIGPRDSLVLGPGALRGMVAGVLELVSSGPITAAADVHGALRGASVLVASPLRG